MYLTLRCYICSLLILSCPVLIMSDKCNKTEFSKNIRNEGTNCSEIIVLIMVLRAANGLSQLQLVWLMLALSSLPLLSCFIYYQRD
jgi:uncharacterized membrane protein YobD (UPF0266 family)